MSYNSNYRNYTGPMYVIAAVLAGLVLVANLFTLKTIFVMFENIRYYASFYILFYLGICLLSLAELALMLAFSISIFARASNEALGKIEVATAIVTGIDLTFRIILLEGHMGWQTAVRYALLLGYYICLAIVIRTGKNVIRKIWFIPGIVVCTSLVFDLAVYGESLRYVAGFESVVTTFFKPVFTIGLAFCLMKWASDRIQDRNTSSNAVSLAPAASQSAVKTAAVTAAVTPAGTGLSVTCPKCGKKMQPHERFCTVCGTKVQDGFCYSCGSPIIAGSAFCNKCGTKVQS